MELFAGVELGGTTTIITIAAKNISQIIYTEEINTTNPDQTLNKCIEIINKYKNNIKGIGIASFGPIDLNKSSKTYGYITSTPKEKWRFACVVQKFQDAFPLISNNIGFDTDVNGAALAEKILGQHGDNINSIAYITVGTGIGCGIVINNQPIHGLLHPEGGHIYPPKHSKDTNFEGVCPYHKNCLEGLASASAIAKG